MRIGIPWERLAAEGAVILASILLALATQAWWEGRQERRQEAQHLAALHEELKEATERLPQFETTLEGVLHDHENLLAQFSASSRAPADSLMFWLSSLSWPADLNVPTAVLTDLTSSGGIQLIESDSIRLGIAEYTALLRRFENQRDQAWGAWADRLQPYLETRVSRVDRIRLGRYGDVPFAQSPFTPSYETLFADVGFESMIAERWIRLDGAGNRLSEMRVVLAELRTLIERELDVP